MAVVIDDKSDKSSNSTLDVKVLASLCVVLFSSFLLFSDVFSMCQGKDVPYIAFYLC